MSTLLFSSKNTVEIRHFHLFCGLGGGAKGFNRGHARVGNLQAKFRCIGGIDVDAGAIKDFDQLAQAKGTVRDLFNREQYESFHGKTPPSDWKEAQPSDIHSACGNEKPHIIFLSAPCKGFSGILQSSLAGTDKYQALNALTLRGVWLALEAFKNSPVELFVFENVPRIASRGRELLDQITSLFRAYGYAVSQAFHDCGSLGGLAQSRRRFLLVARHIEKVPPHLYQPAQHPLRAVGDVLSRLPLPGDESAGPMHRIPSLQWKTWVRLAFIEAGKDWRSLQDLNVKDGFLSEYLIVPDYRAGYLGVNKWNDTMGTVAGRSLPSNGNYSIADPRYFGNISGTFSKQSLPGQSQFSVADPRGSCFAGKYKVTRFDESSSTVISASTTGQGAFAVADPRYRNPSTRGKLDLSPLFPSEQPLPQPNDRVIATIRALDGTVHRPLTCAELCLLQGLYDPNDEGLFSLSGQSESVWRERIGNAVPPPAAEAIASVMGEVLLLAQMGETFTLSSTPVWVRPLATALAVDLPGAVE